MGHGPCGPHVARLLHGFEQPSKSVAVRIAVALKQSESVIDTNPLGQNRRHQESATAQSTTMDHNASAMYKHKKQPPPLRLLRLVLFFGFLRLVVATNSFRPGAIGHLLEDVEE